MRNIDPKPDMVRRTFYLPLPLETWLRDTAAREDYSVSQLIVRTLRQASDAKP